jgi:antitoxin MazE
MNAEVKKWGNSLAVRLPKSFVDNFKMTNGSKVELVLKKNSIEIVPKQPREYSLKSMLQNINENSLHDEIDTGHSVGAEL